MNTTGSPAQVFSDDHRRCDELWGEVEASADDPAACQKRFEEFERAMLRHFAMEEEVLFPAFEEATGMRGGGPTHVMRLEHAQMKGLLAEMSGAVEKGDFATALDGGDTLLMLIQQHNVKEEGVLYPMVDDVLGSRWPELSEKLAKI